jgi:hypothetical protein
MGRTRCFRKNSNIFSQIFETAAADFTASQENNLRAGVVLKPLLVRNTGEVLFICGYDENLFQKW